MPDSSETTVAPDTASSDSQIWDSAPETPPAADPTPAVASPASEPTRDVTGKFSKAPASTAPVEPELPETPPAETVPEATDTPVPEGETPPEPEAVYPEFEYAVNGRALNIPGSKVGEDGAFIPKAQMDRITQILIRGHQSGQRDRENDAKVRAARSEGQAEVEQARRVMAAFGALTKDKEKYLAFGENLEKNRETLMLRAELDAVKAEKDKVGQQWTEHEQTQAAEALVPKLQNGLQAVIGKYAGKPDYAGVDTAKLYERLMHRHFDQVFSENESGEVLIDEEFIEDEMAFAASAMARGRDEVTKATKAKATIESVTKENAQRQGQSGAKPPPMAGVGKGGKPSNPPAKKFTNTRDADRDIWDS